MNPLETYLRTLQATQPAASQPFAPDNIAGLLDTGLQDLTYQDAYGRTQRGRASRAVNAADPSAALFGFGPQHLYWSPNDFTAPRSQPASVGGGLGGGAAAGSDGGLGASTGDSADGGFSAPAAPGAASVANGVIGLMGNIAMSAVPGLASVVGQVTGLPGLTTSLGMIGKGVAADPSAISISDPDSVGLGLGPGIGDAGFGETVGLGAMGDAMGLAESMGMDGLGAVGLGTGLGLGFGMGADAGIGGSGGESGGGLGGVGDGSVGDGMGGFGGGFGSDGLGGIGAAGGFGADGGLGVGDAGDAGDSGGEGGGGGGGGGGCFITEAVMASGGEGDDAFELQVLRKFRDEVMRADPQLAELEAAYQRLAPMVVQAINQRPDSQQVYQRLGASFIDPAVRAILGGQMDQALQLYAAGVAEAERLAAEAEPSAGRRARMEPLGVVAEQVAVAPTGGGALAVLNGGEQ